MHFLVIRVYIIDAPYIPYNKICEILQNDCKPQLYYEIINTT